MKNRKPWVVIAGLFVALAAIQTVYASITRSSADSGTPAARAAADEGKSFDCGSCPGHSEK